MSQIKIANTKALFPDLAEKAAAGNEDVVARDNHPKGKLAPAGAPTGKRRPGSARGKLLDMADDFDDTPEDFTE